MTVSGAVNVIDPKELWVIVLVLIQTMRMVEQENTVKRLQMSYWNCAAQIRPFQNLWHERTMICSTSRNGVGARVLDEVMALR